MSISHEEELGLMAFADGELEGEARGRAEALLAESAEARLVVAAIRAACIDRWVGDVIERRDRTADGIATLVMARIDAGAMGDAQPSDAHAAVATLARARFRRSTRTALVFGGAAMVAAAAVLVLVVRGRPEGRSAVVATTAAPAPRTSASAVAEDNEQSASAAGGVVVDEIDSPARQVSIFQIPSMAHAASSVVVWIDEDPGTK